MKPSDVKKIYFDMDGVLADFEGGVINLCGFRPPMQSDKNCTKEDEDHLWEEIRKVDHFYAKLGLIPGAKELFDEVYEKYGDRCEILTGVPKPHRNIEHSKEDKVEWIRRLLSEEVVVNTVLRKEKVQFCTGPECILIDDFDKNTNEWDSFGGTSVLYTDAKSAREKLCELGIL